MERKSLVSKSGSYKISNKMMKQCEVNSCGLVNLHLRYYYYCCYEYYYYCYANQAHHLNCLDAQTSSISSDICRYCYYCWFLANPHDYRYATPSAKMKRCIHSIYSCRHCFEDVLRIIWMLLRIFLLKWVKISCYLFCHRSKYPYDCRPRPSPSHSNCTHYARTEYRLYHARLWPKDLAPDRSVALS